MADIKSNDFSYEGAHEADERYGDTPGGRKLLSDPELGEKVLDDSNRIAELKHKLAHDQLTGISSRGELDRTYKEIIEKDEIACMLYIDVDKFKRFNDDFGHVSGDILLKTLASRLKTHVQTEDVVGREGGEEFVILLRNFGDIVVAERRANEIREEVGRNKFVLSDGQIVNMNISMGVSVREEGETIESWRNRTDMALREAKNTGRNKVVVAQSP